MIYIMRKLIKKKKHVNLLNHNKLMILFLLALRYIEYNFYSAFAGKNYWLKIKYSHKSQV